MKTQRIEPCDIHVPEPLQRAADQAERRKDDVLNRLLVKLDANGRGAEIERIIDADAALSAVRDWK